MIRDLFRRWRATWQPDMYHGWGRTRRYFEGWYFKVVSADGAHAMAFIPGISMPSDGSPPHAFIQVMYGSENRSVYHPFTTADFRPAHDHFALHLGPNFFSKERLQLDLPGVTGTLAFHQNTPWPKMLGAPGIMGWYSFVPRMECFHGVVSLHHTLEGILNIDGRQVDFSGGKGYIEKDWGRSFPRAYVWMQTNHFSTTDRASLLASVAHIPWMGSYFIGFISGFWLENKLLRFATYTGAKKYLEIGADTATLIYTNPHSELRLLAHRAEGTALVSPLSGDMTGKISESLQAVIDVELIENGRRIFEDSGRHAGLEIAGETGLLEA